MIEPSVLLSTLLCGASPQKIVGQTMSEKKTVSAVFCDSRAAKKHGNRGLFVCIAGAAFDGHRFAKSAYDAGCRIFAVSHPIDLPADAVQLVYDDTRRALASLSSAFYDYPAKKLKIIGVTGTKGKTTTCLIAYSLLCRAGIVAGYIGTNGIRYCDHVEETANTTPESLTLQRVMRDMADAGVRVLVMEVSSQALMLNRVHGIPFDTVVFTNLSSDHIGGCEHPSFEAYRDEKRKLFSDYGAKRILLNADDPRSAEMLPAKVDAKIETFSVCEALRDKTLPPPVLSAFEIDAVRNEHGVPSSSFRLYDASEARESFANLSLLGRCNIYNALAALSICRACGLSSRDTVTGLTEVSIPGRGEVISTANGVRVVIDYAHNEVSLREILTGLRPYTEKRLIVLFGSVGGRTENRRKPMGEVASRFADFCILTSDNPDAEPPMQILGQILEGFVKVDPAPAVLIPDRREAIAFALSTAQRGDVVLLAGKGDESYQLINGEKIPFSERQIVREILCDSSAEFARLAEI